MKLKRIIGRTLSFLSLGMAFILMFGEVKTNIPHWPVLQLFFYFLGIALLFITFLLNEKYGVPFMEDATEEDDYDDYEEDEED